MKYKDKTGGERETFAIGDLIGAEHGYNVDVPEGYAASITAAIQAMATTASNLAVADRFSVVDGVVMMACRSKYAEPSGNHKWGRHLPIDRFAKSAVARLSHTCKECAKKASRTKLRKRTDPGKQGPIRYFVVDASDHTTEHKTFEEAAEFLGNTSAPSAGAIIEGRYIPVKRQVVYVRDES